MSNVPKLRFKEFNAKWEEKIFGNIVTNKSKKYNPEKEKISYKCIELEHLSSETGQLLGYIDSLNAGSIKNKFSKNDVLFGKLRPYLKKYLLSPFDGVCSSEIWVLNGIDVINSFLYYIVQSDYFITLSNQSSGSKMPRADWQIIENSIFFIPSKQEQEKIASFLTSVDTKIEQLTKKEELLQQYKKGVIRKIFSQEIRFKSDDGSMFCDWKKEKLSKYLIEYKNKSTFENEYPVLTSSNKGLMLQSDYFGGNRLTERDNIGFNIVPNNFITYRSRSDNRTFTFNINTLGYIGIISTYYPVFECKNADNRFIVTLLNKNKHFIGKYSVGTSQTVLSFNELKNIKMLIPCIEEQNKIANFLSSIDTKIEQTQKQLKSSKEFKKAILQQMFV